MSRNASGTYALPSGNPVSPGTTITTNWANSTLNDIGSSLTDSLSRTGLGGMQAALRLPEGTDPLPVLSFTADITAGLRFDFPTSELRMLRQSTVIQKWTLTGTTIPVLLTLSKGATVTTSTTNGNGLASTGNGTASGVVGTGGSTAGVGVVGVGGAGGGTGLTGTGVGTGGFGLVAVGGTGTSAINATGGSGTSGGVQAAGSGAGTGVAATGGSGSGTGVMGTGGAGAGVGLVGVGGGTGAGASLANGTAATSTVRAAAAVFSNGDLSFAGTANAASTAGFSNALTPTSLIKAWARITTTGGASTTVVVDAGFNIASVTLSTVTITIVLTTAVAIPAVALVSQNGTGGPTLVLSANCSTTSIVLRAVDLAGDVAAPIQDPYSFQAGAGVTIGVILMAYQ